MGALGRPLADTHARVYVAGHRGLVGSAIVRELQRRGFDNLLLRTHAELELVDAAAVRRFFAKERPEYVVLAAARVGGILANNTYPAEFIRDNLDIQNSVIEACHENGVQRMLFLGSSCIYPKLCPQPIREEYLLTGPLEPTNQPYALAKIAGIEMCWSYNRQYGTRYLAAMPTNLYGPDDNFDLKTSHVLPALLRKAHEAKKNGERAMTVWGTGTPRREFLHADDAANACVFLLELEAARFDSLLREEAAPLVNIGTGEDLTIRELAERVARTVGFAGEVAFDASKPDGTPRKLLDVSRMQGLGWRHSIELEEGLRRTYEAVRMQL
jgi:GDP-L-fucose synthase